MVRACVIISLLSGVFGVISAKQETAVFTQNELDEIEWFLTDLKNEEIKEKEEVIFKKGIYSQS